MSSDDDTDDEPTISVNDLSHWLASYAIDHEGTDRERIADEIAAYIDEQREKRTHVGQ